MVRATVGKLEGEAAIQALGILEGDLQLLVVLPALVMTTNGLWIWLALIWLLGIMLVPVFQRDRRRVGEIRRRQ